MEKNCQNWLVDLLKSILKQESQNETKSAEITARLTKICDSIVEQLLRIDEENAAKSPKKADPTKKEPSRLVVYITALSLVGQASPVSLISHVETLEPYLKSQAS